MGAVVIHVDLVRGVSRFTSNFAGWGEGTGFRIVFAFILSKEICPAHTRHTHATHTQHTHTRHTHATHTRHMRMRSSAFVRARIRAYPFVCVRMRAYACACVRKRAYACVCVRMRAYARHTHASHTPHTRHTHATHTPHTRHTQRLTHATYTPHTRHTHAGPPFCLSWPPIGFPLAFLVQLRGFFLWLWSLRHTCTGSFQEVGKVRTGSLKKKTHTLHTTSQT